MRNAFVRFAACSLAALAACAPSPGAGPAPNARASGVVVVSADPNSNIPEVHSSTPVSSRTSTTLPPDTAFAAVQGAYAALGIPLTVRDSAAGRIGNEGLAVHGHLNGHLLSNYLNCGQTLVVNHADQDQIILSIVSTVRRAGFGSTVETLVMATATDRTSGNAGVRNNCTSTGNLETALHRAAFGQP